MKSPQVYIVGMNTDWDSDYHVMFYNNGWDVSLDLKSADLVQFTGGEDVTPHLYGESKHPRTSSNFIRDEREIILFNRALELKKPMAGICRGGQFLNVMCGGALWQHVDNHAVGKAHEVIDVVTKERFRATSTHHQMMRPGKDATIVGIAYESTKKERMVKSGHTSTLFVDGRKGIENADMEVLVYTNKRVLCFQPHPEFAGFPELTKTYFDYIKTYIL